MSERRDAIATAATLIAEVAYLFPALGIFGVFFAHAGSPLPLLLTAALMGLAFAAGRAVPWLVADGAQRASCQALLGLPAVYLAISLLAPGGGAGLLWGARLFGGYSGQAAGALILGAAAAAFVWYRGVRIAGESLPVDRLLRTFRTGIVVLALSFLAEQAFGVDCYATVMLVPFFAVSLAGLAFARQPPGGAWARATGLALAGVLGGGLVIGLIGATAGGRGLSLLGTAWGYLIGAVIWLLELLLVPLLALIFEAIAWLMGEPGPRQPGSTRLRVPGGDWREQFDGVAVLPYADVLVGLLKYPALLLAFYVLYRLLRRAYRGYAKRALAAQLAERESIQGNADAASDLIALALGLLPDWMFPKAPPEGPRYPKDRPGITEAYALYFELLAAARKQGCPFEAAATPSERLATLESALPRAPAARITACFNAACYGNLATDRTTLQDLRHELLEA
jgi:hypothetical protein